MLSIFKNFQEEADLLESYISKQAAKNGALKILEAGCGRRWAIKPNGVQYHLTGIDMDKKALEIRKYETKDLDEIIEGDLRTAQLPNDNYDVIYNSFVLEHIDGAEKVMQNFYQWLRPGGIAIVRFPDRNSAYGFLTRLTPFWVHVFVKKYIQGNPNAGKPGYDPYPTYHDLIVSTKGMRSFCEKNNFVIREEKGHPYPSEWDRFKLPISLVTRLVYLLSFGKFAYAHNNLTYILEKK